MSARRTTGWLLGVMVIFLAGCATITTTSQHDPQADFSSYSTYSWITPDDAGVTFKPQPHLDLRFRRVVDDTLVDKGFELSVAKPQADLLLVYYMAIESKLQVTSTPSVSPYQYGYWSGSPWGYTDARIVREGTVVLDMVDRKTKQLVWTGSVSGVIRRANPPSDRIAKVVAQLLEDFPPAS